MNVASQVYVAPRVVAGCVCPPARVVYISPLVYVPLQVLDKHILLLLLYQGGDYY